MEAHFGSVRSRVRIEKRSERKWPKTALLLFHFPIVMNIHKAKDQKVTSGLSFLVKLI